MTVSKGILIIGKKPLWHDQMQAVFRPCHRDIEQPPFLFELSRRSGTEVGWQAAIDDVEQEDEFPFLPIGGMDRGEDEEILVEMRHAGLIACCIERIERQLGQEFFA